MNTHDINILHEWLGDKGIITDEKECAPYTRCMRGGEGKAIAVLRPNSTEDVSKIMAYCSKQNIHIIPQSGNTGLVGGSVPDESGSQAVLSLERMNKIYNIDPINSSAHIGSGLRLSALNSSCEEYGLHLPIDLGSDPCIGGMVSTNSGGSRFIKYRGLREHVMGLKAVLADDNGTIIDVLIPLHKDNTGFDVKQLFIGSGGIFGIVTEAIILLASKTQQSAAALLIPTSIDTINTLLLEIKNRCGTYLSAIEGMSGNAIKCALEHNSSLSSPFGQDDIPDYTILVELSRTWEPREGEQPLDDVLESILSEIWDGKENLLDNALIGTPEKLWKLRHSISEGVQKSGTLYAFDVSFKRGDLIHFRTHMTEQLKEHYPDLTLCDFGHIGDGAMHCSLVLNHNDPRGQDPKFEKELRTWVNDQVVLKFGGSYSAEHGLGRKVQGAYDAYTPAEVKSLTQSIKSAIAPTPIGTIKI